MVQTCSLCKNHGFETLKKGHKSQCPYLIDSHWKICLEGCQDTRLRQISVAEDKKNKYRLNKSEKKKQLARDGKKRAAKTCSKCKNHKEDALMNTKHLCPYRNCGCEACKITDQRRGHVKTDVINFRLNQKSIFITPPSTPGSSSCVSSPRSAAVSDVEAASPLRSDDSSFADSMLTPISLPYSPADLEAQSPAPTIVSQGTDLFNTLALLDMSSPSATFVQQDFGMMMAENELDSYFNVLEALPQQKDTCFDSEMTDILEDLLELDEANQQYIEKFCTESKKV